MGKITEYRRITTLTTEICFSDLWRPDYQDHGLARLLSCGTFLLGLQFVFFLNSCVPSVTQCVYFQVPVKTIVKWGEDPTWQPPVEVKHLLKGSVLLSSLGFFMWMCFQGSYVANIIEEMVTVNMTVRCHGRVWGRMADRGWRKERERRVISFDFN